ncbi:hypothetical protein VTI74DRAFT_185 [Chaetomium olivicolor]
MNNAYLLRDVWPVNSNKYSEPNLWPEDCFDSFRSICGTLDTHTFRSSTKESNIPPPLFLTRRFQVVFTPYMAPGSSLNAMAEMDLFGPLMASITIEVDFTKLAGGRQPEALNFNASAGLDRLKRLIERFVERQLTRRVTRIQDLRVLVRRYYGYRPQVDSSKMPGMKEMLTAPPLPSVAEPDRPVIPYTSDTDVSYVLSPLKRLGPLVDSLIITGAFKIFATELVMSFSEAGQPSEPNCKVHGDPKSTLLPPNITYRTPAVEYPLLPGQSCVLDYGPDNGGLKVVKYEGSWDEWRGLHGPSGSAADPANTTQTTMTKVIQVTTIDNDATANAEKAKATGTAPAA